MVFNILYNEYTLIFEMVSVVFAHECLKLLHRAIEVKN